MSRKFLCKLPGKVKINNYWFSAFCFLFNLATICLSYKPLFKLKKCLFYICWCTYNQTCFYKWNEIFNFILSSLFYYFYLKCVWIKTNSVFWIFFLYSVDKFYLIFIAFLTGNYFISNIFYDHVLALIAQNLFTVIFKYLYCKNL